MGVKLLGLIFTILLSADAQASAAVPSLPAQVQIASQTSADLTEAATLSDSAVKLYNEGKYKQALKPGKRALEIMDATLPADDKRVIDAVSNLAAIHLKLNNLKEAEALYKRILVADEKGPGADSLKAANTIEMLAWVHYARGDVTQAQADYERVLAIKEKAAGVDSLEVAQTLYRLAEIYHLNDSPEKAQPLYRRLLAFDDELALESNLTVKDALLSYQCLLRKMKKVDEDLKKRFQNNSQEQGGSGVSTQGDGPVDRGILNGMALRLQKPAYPDGARSARVSGTVVVMITITEEGKVVRACAVNGHPLLWRAAETAAYGSEFSPTILHGKPVRVTGVISYSFR